MEKVTKTWLRGQHELAKKYPKEGSAGKIETQIRILQEVEEMYPNSEELLLQPWEKRYFDFQTPEKVIQQFVDIYGEDELIRQVELYFKK